MNAETTRRVMTTAHQIRRSAAERFNCLISEILWSECLRMAWAEVKTASKKHSIVNTIRTFTNSWTKPGTNEERLYLDKGKTADFIGLEADRYKSGSIKSAILNGEKISNNYAFKIFLSMDKAYYNVQNGKWYALSDEAIDLIIEKIDA